jgi:hypothetical protein
MVSALGGIGRCLLEAFQGAITGGLGTRLVPRLLCLRRVVLLGNFQQWVALQGLLDLLL